MELDKARADAFGHQVFGMMNNAMLSLMTSIGHQTGLFDTMAKLPPSTSKQIADASGLNERYVREWLASLVTGRIVDHDSAKGTYVLPPEHAAFLTRAAGPNNFARFLQCVGEFARVELKVADCFKSGGGVPYSEFDRFQKLMSEMSGEIHDAALVGGILPLVPGIVERLQSGIDVADVGCGAGHAINLMAKAFPKSRFVGYDFSEEGIGFGRAEADKLGLKNARFEVKDVAALDAKAAFDLITAFDTIHDQAKPDKVLAVIHAALRPGGAFLCVDIAGSSHVAENMEHPMAPGMYAVSTLHCMTVSLAQGGAGLGAMWGEQKARQMIAEAGFGDVAVQKVEGDFLNNYYIARKA